MSNYESVLAGIQSKLKKKSSKTARMLSDGPSSEIREVIPTGIMPVDNYVIGCGGLPVGRITELYSEEGGGKSSLMLQCCASVQAQGGLAVIVETEDALDTERAETFGVDLSKVILLEPDHLEEALDMLDATLTSMKDVQGPVLVAWDSLAATPTKAELTDGLVGGEVVAGRARLMGRACRSLGTLVNDNNVALLVINQTRTKMGVLFGNNTTTPGGKGMKFLASLRLQIMGGKAVKNEHGEHTAKDVTVLATKNRMAPPYRKCRVRLNFAEGFDNQWSVLDHAKERGIIKPRSRGEKAYNEAIEQLGWVSKDAE